jgi:NitT/TauT family transport system substrate-binding protein
VKVFLRGNTMRRILMSASLILVGGNAFAAEKLSFLTSWRAQAEHGGYYQALAKGYYEQCGVDLTLRQGGPGLDGKQLLVAGSVDIMSASFNDTAIQVNVAGFPAKAVFAMFQKNPQILMTHPGVGLDSFEAMKGRPIMIGAASRSTFWPFLKAKFGFVDSQIASYSGQMAPWMADKMAIQQALITNEPHRVEAATGEKPNTLLFADYGYNAYASVAVTSQKLIAEKPATIQCFVDASIKGWADFLRDPAPAVALIRKDNPDNPDDVVQYAIDKIRSAGIVETSDTASLGIGAMSDERWKAHTELMKASGLAPADFNYRDAFTLSFINKRVGL